MYVASSYCTSTAQKYIQYCTYTLRYITVAKVFLFFLPSYVTASYNVCALYCTTVYYIGVYCDVQWGESGSGSSSSKTARKAGKNSIASQWLPPPGWSDGEGGCLEIPPNPQPSSSSSSSSIHHLSSKTVEEGGSMQVERKELGLVGGGKRGGWLPLPVSAPLGWLVGMCKILPFNFLSWRREEEEKSKNTTKGFFPFFPSC